MNNEVKRGQTISFRIPSDTPDHLLKHLQKLKQIERRNFSSKMAEFVLEGVGKSSSKERETIQIPLPHQLNKVQRDWLKHEHSEALLGNIVYQLLSDPVRATSLLASMNSKSLDIDEALYLQEKSVGVTSIRSGEVKSEGGTPAVAIGIEKADDDLDNFDWESVKQTEQPVLEEETSDSDDDLGDLLGDFLAKMNK